MLKRLTLVKFCSYFGNIETKKVIRKRKLFDQWKLVFSREIFWPCFLICFKWSWCFIDFFLGRNLVYLETSDNNDNYNKRSKSFITLEIINLNTFYFNSLPKFVFFRKRKTSRTVWWNWNWPKTSSRLKSENWPDSSFRFGTRCTKKIPDFSDRQKKGPNRSLPSSLSPMIRRRKNRKMLNSEISIFLNFQENWAQSWEQLSSCQR